MWTHEKMILIEEMQVETPKNLIRCLRYAKKDDEPNQFVYDFVQDMCHFFSGKKPDFIKEYSKRYDFTDCIFYQEDVEE